MSATKTPSKFDLVIRTVNAAEKATTTVWASVVAFAIDVSPSQDKDTFKKAYRAEEKANSARFDADVSTYRSAKSTITRAWEAGITVIGPDGQAIPKMKVEEAIKSLTEEQTPFQKFSAGMAKLSKLVDKLEGTELLSANVMANDLQAKFQPRVALKKAA